MPKPNTLDLDALEAIRYETMFSSSGEDRDRWFFALADAAPALIKAARERDALAAELSEARHHAVVAEFNLKSERGETNRVHAELATARAHMRQAVGALFELRNTFEDIFHEQRATKAIQELSNNGLDILDRLTAALGDQPPVPASTEEGE